MSDSPTLDWLKSMKVPCTALPLDGKCQACEDEAKGKTVLPTVEMDYATLEKRLFWGLLHPYQKEELKILLDESHVLPTTHPSYSPPWVLWPRKHYPYGGIGTVTGRMSYRESSSFLQQWFQERRREEARRKERDELIEIVLKFSKAPPSVVLHSLSSMTGRKRDDKDLYYRALYDSQRVFSRRKQ